MTQEAHIALFTVCSCLEYARIVYTQVSVIVHCLLFSVKTQVSATHFCLSTEWTPRSIGVLLESPFHRLSSKLKTLTVPRCLSDTSSDMYAFQRLFVGGGGGGGGGRDKYQTPLFSHTSFKL